MQRQTELLTIQDFAGALHVTSACVRRWITERKITTVKLGRLVRIPAAEIDRLVQEGMRPAQGSAK
jgi:excisionase family DNA binding protein